VWKTGDSFLLSEAGTGDGVKNTAAVLTFQVLLCMIFALRREMGHVCPASFFAKQKLHGGLT
jgi:hypothetical protein